MKKLIAILMTIMLVAALMPLSASAAEDRIRITGVSISNTDLRQQPTITIYGENLPPLRYNLTLNAGNAYYNLRVVAFRGTQYSVTFGCPPCGFGIDNVNLREDRTELSFRLRVYSSSRYYQQLAQVDTITVTIGPYEADVHSSPSQRISITFPKNDPGSYTVIYPYPEDPDPPAKPEGLTAVPGDRTVTLYWTLDTSLAGYNIYRNGLQLNNEPVYDYTYTDTGLINGQTYTYRIQAVDHGGLVSELSDPVTATPEKASYMPPPPAPTGLSGTAGNQQVDLSWDDVGDGIGYFVYANGKRVNYTPIYTNHIHIGNLEARTYRFEVSAVNEQGIESEKSAPIFLDVYDLVPKVTGRAGNGQVTLRWTSVPGATFYYIYRDGVLIGSTANTEYIDNEVDNGTVYEYQVSAEVDGDIYGPSDPVRLRPGEYIDFPGWTESIVDVIQTAFSFVRKYAPYILAVLGIIVTPTIIAFLLWLWRRPKQQQPAGRWDAAERERSERDVRRERISAERVRRDLPGRYRDPEGRVSRIRLERIERIRAVREASRTARVIRSERVQRPQRQLRQGRERT